MKNRILIMSALIGALGNAAYAAESDSPPILSAIDQSTVEQLSNGDQQSRRGQSFFGANAGNRASNWCKGRGVCFTYNIRGGVRAADPYLKKKWGIVYGTGVRYVAHR